MEGIEENSEGLPQSGRSLPGATTGEWQHVCRLFPHLCILSQPLTLSAVITVIFRTLEEQNEWDEKKCEFLKSALKIGTSGESCRRRENLVLTQSVRLVPQQLE